MLTENHNNFKMKGFNILGIRQFPGVVHEFNWLVAIQPEDSQSVNTILYHLFNEHGVCARLGVPNIQKRSIFEGKVRFSLEKGETILRMHLDRSVPVSDRTTACFRVHEDGTITDELPASRRKVDENKVYENVYAVFRLKEPVGSSKFVAIVSRGTHYEAVFVNDDGESDEGEKLVEIPTGPYWYFVIFKDGSTLVCDKDSIGHSRYDDCLCRIVVRGSGHVSSFK